MSRGLLSVKRGIGCSGSVMARRAQWAAAKLRDSVDIRFRRRDQRKRHEETRHGQRDARVASLRHHDVTGGALGGDVKVRAKRWSGARGDHEIVRPKVARFEARRDLPKGPDGEVHDLAIAVGKEGRPGEVQPPDHLHSAEFYAYQCQPGAPRLAICGRRKAVTPSAHRP